MRSFALPQQQTTTYLDKEATGVLGNSVAAACCMGVAGGGPVLPPVAGVMVSLAGVVGFMAFFLALDLA